MTLITCKMPKSKPGVDRENRGEVNPSARSNDSSPIDTILDIIRQLLPPNIIYALFAQVRNSIKIIYYNAQKFFRRKRGEESPKSNGTAEMKPRGTPIHALESVLFPMI